MLEDGSGSLSKGYNGKRLLGFSGHLFRVDFTFLGICNTYVTAVVFGTSKQDSWIAGSYPLVNPGCNPSHYSSWAERVGLFLDSCIILFFFLSDIMALLMVSGFFCF